MRIDAHHHFWNFDPERDAWITPEMEVIQKNFLPKNLKPLLAASGIDGTVAVQADQSDEETIFLLSLAEKNNFIKGVVGWVDLRADDLEQQLRNYVGRKLLKGFRHIIQGERDSKFMIRPEFIRGISTIHRLGYTYDVLIYHHQLPMAIEFVRSCPEIPLVVDHLAKPPIKDGNWQTWAKGMRMLADFPNVHCKVSGMVTEADWFKWKSEDFKVYLDVVTEAFGPGRLMYGSDWPVCLIAATYEQQLLLLENYFSQFTPSERAAVFGLNAKKFYRL
jgi:L-fuconolactonase